MKAKVLITPILYFLLVCSTHTFGQENDNTWNMFRGPNGSGVVESGTLPGDIGPSLNVIWKVDIPTGYSSPVLTKDYVFLTAEEDGDLFTYCLARQDGNIVWKSMAARPRTEKLDNRNNAASPSVVTDGKSVYVFFADFGLLAYDLSGKELWNVPLGPFNNVYGMGASPILADDLIVLVIDQNIDSYIIAVSKNSGEVVWRVNRLSFEMKFTPVIWKDMVFINGYATPMNQSENIVEIPNFQKAITDFDKDKSGGLSRAELPKGGTHFYASPIGSDDKIYIISRRGKVSVLKSGGQIEPVSQNDLEEMCFATPAISNGKIYLRTDNTLYCFGMK